MTATSIFYVTRLTFRLLLHCGIKTVYERPFETTYAPGAGTRLVPRAWRPGIKRVNRAKEFTFSISSKRSTLTLRGRRQTVSPASVRVPPVTAGDRTHF
jgi:hypothetical protein